MPVARSFNPLLNIRKKISPARLGVISAALATVGIIVVILAHAATTVGPSGVAMPAGDLNGWKLIFNDDFTTDVPLGGFSG